MSTHNICFHEEIRKILPGTSSYPELCNIMCFSTGSISSVERLLSDMPVFTVFTLSIRTPQLLTIYVLKFEPVQFTTRCV